MTFMNLGSSIKSSQAGGASNLVLMLIYYGTQYDGTRFELVADGSVRDPAQNSIEQVAKGGCDLQSKCIKDQCDSPRIWM